MIIANTKDSDPINLYLFVSWLVKSLWARSCAHAPRGGQTPHVMVITPTRDGSQGTSSVERVSGIYSELEVLFV